MVTVPPIRFTVPVGGGELRISREGDRVEVQAWTVYADGHGMMAGGLRLGAQDVRLLLHGLKYLLWDLERGELPGRRDAA